jgi:hypothetical protein
MDVVGRKIKRAHMICLVILTVTMASLSQTRPQPGVQMTKVLGRDILYKSIMEWTDERQNFLQRYFQRELGVKIEDEASDFLIQRYLQQQVEHGKWEERKLDPGFEVSPELMRFVLKMDIIAVLERAFEDAVQRQYGTLYKFISKEHPVLSIGKLNIDVALHEQDCSIIPCPPDRCGPDCSPKAFPHFLQAVGICPSSPE